MSNYMVSMTEKYVAEQKKDCDEMHRLIAESNRMLDNIRLDILSREDRELARRSEMLAQKMI